MDKEKCYELISNRIGTILYLGFDEDPMTNEHFWIPLSDELSKNPDETIDFWETLTAEEFAYSLECLEETIQKSQSGKLLEAVRRIGIEKGCDMKEIESRIEDAECWLEDEANI